MQNKVKAKMNLNRYAVPALEKGLDILEALAAADVPQSLGEFAKILERSPNELFRMLNCLEGRGYLSKDPASLRYSLTLKLYELAHTHSPVEAILEAARRPMAELSEQVQESCHLSILHRNDLMVIGQAFGPARTRLSIEIGGKFNPIATASGRLLLAYLSQTEREDILGLNAAHEPALLKTLNRIRKAGISTAEDETYIGVHDVAILIGNPDVSLTAALTVSFIARSSSKTGQREIVNDIIKHTRAAVQKINRNLGLKPTP
jgi:DNA-binding IclR family transcriptional regulator